MQTLAVPELIDTPAPGRLGMLRHWRPWRQAALVALACAALVAGWQLARPLVAEQLAEAVPPALEARLGQGMLRELDRHTLLPSELSDGRQARISAAFASLQAPHEGAPRRQLLFRSGHAGAAAFTLPSGDIILTDQLLLALPDDGAVLAVLAHELGHQQRRHMLRRLVREAILPAGAAIVLGDTDWLVASVAARAPQLAWPLQAEIEADQYAADLLEHNGLSLRNLAELQETLAGTDGPQRAYLAIHPPCAERLAQQRERSAL
ncbi:M48 family metallopeptidase [Pseudoduganella violaceinigra]|uniref:M48 family metallopeptidase n=1 Tax=Pseudoduganella violaceinigra TaxID=246602 RepID=UPI00041F9EC3|nr:M48 family metallopeptidase [Pseudoduganella violaceinigra]